MSVTTTLHKAADLIERWGLAHGQHVAITDELDIQEAIWRAATNTSQAYYWKCRQRDEMIITLDQHNKYRWAIITFRNWLKAQGEEDQPALWGDAHNTEEVVAALRACAESDRKD